MLNQISRNDEEDVDADKSATHWRLSARSGEGWLPKVLPNVIARVSINRQLSQAKGVVSRIDARVAKTTVRDNGNPEALSLAGSIRRKANSIPSGCSR